MITPSLGRIVLYRLDEYDAAAIRHRRGQRVEASDLTVEGLRSIVTVFAAGNNPAAGDVYPMVITRVWGPTPESAANGQVLLDGDDTLWVTSRSQWVTDPGEERTVEALPEGRWMAPPRV